MLQYLSVLLIFCLGKWWHRSADAEALRFLLAPTDTLVGLATGSTGNWRAGEGYLHAGPHFIIDASCAGFNFLLIGFLLLAYLLLRRFTAWWTIPVALIAAWPLTILANTSRILTILTLGPAPLGIKDTAWHEGQGAFVYLSVLVIAGGLLTYWLKSAESTSLSNA
ncbi:exosortase K [Neolewinella aurantiaca]|uniref:Exosortase K n=1 Tax=Neolewinella aurantiaca TaxID=2602767 RepID=A0A5C7FL84_9BACT|nr:exosortase K [Neolewinella aurantiaca]TXF90803.1 exosortase K [Neolewinella aurantiaca]